jgi:2-oxoglutarate ferredoxin oxidoreductase subunit gamma
MSVAIAEAPTASTQVRPRTEILISGFGGQGVIRLGQILGLTAIEQGLRVTMLKSHGTETRGGYVRAQLVISPDYVDSPVVEHADYFVAFSASAYKKFYDLATGVIIYDPETCPEQNLRPGDKPHIAVAATGLAKQHFNNALFANMIILGALVRLASLDLQAVRSTLVKVLPRFHDQNLRALDLGYSLPAAVDFAQASRGGPPEALP